MVPGVHTPIGPPLRLGGAGEAVAADLVGHRVTYAEFADLIGVVDTGPALLDVTGLEPVHALAVIFAGARAGRPVLVGDPTGSAPSANALSATAPSAETLSAETLLARALPAGTFLVAITSGSSGHPRLVARTAASWTASFAPLAALAGLSAADRVLLTGRLSSTLHLFAAVHTLAIGATLTDRPADATAVHAVPAVLESLLTDLPADAPLRTAVVAGSALTLRVEHRAAARGITLQEYYGAAELSFVAARIAPGPLQPFPGVQLRIDPNGVLWARSPYLAIGYVPAASPTSPALTVPPASPVRSAQPVTPILPAPTVSYVQLAMPATPVAPGAPALLVLDAGAALPTGAVDPLRRDAAGFATVGDLASWIEPGDPSAGLLIRGRGDAAITTGGHTVLAEDVESVLIELPGVVAAAVVGAPHERLGQLLTAVIELDTGVTGAAIRSAARAQLAGPSLPRRWLQTDGLPRTTGGKVARAAVLAGLADGTLPVRPLP